MSDEGADALPSPELPSAERARELHALHAAHIRLSSAEHADTALLLADQIDLRALLEESLEALRRGDLERHEWTPQQALEFYAAGKHFDVVDGRTRIIDTGAVASDALKQVSAQYAGMKGVEPTAQARESAALLQARNEVDQRRIALLEKTLKNLSFAAQITGGVAGRDDGLVAAIDEAAKVLDVNTYEIEPVPSAQAREALELGANALEQRAASFLFHDKHNEYGKKLEACVATLRSLISLLGLSANAGDAGDAWQPIETAPEDASNILLGHPAFVTEGYRDVDGEHHCCVIGKPITAFTHWRPLPAPPKAGAR